MKLIGIKFMGSWLRPFFRKYIFSRYKRAFSGAERNRYLSRTNSPRLNLGCGSNSVNGWYNTDLYPGFRASYLDFSKPFPFPDGIFAGAFSEHTIEHVPKPVAQYMCKEAYRVLAPGAPIRIVTPSMELMAKYALAPDSDEARRYLTLFRELDGSGASITDAINDMFYGHGHRYIYTAYELASMLRDSGFLDIRLLSMQSPGDPLFAGVDGHGNVIGAELNALCSIAVEARK